MQGVDSCSGEGDALREIVVGNNDDLNNDADSGTRGGVGRRGVEQRGCMVCPHGSPQKNEGIIIDKKGRLVNGALREGVGEPIMVDCGGADVWLGDGCDDFVWDRGVPGF